MLLKPVQPVPATFNTIMPENTFYSRYLVGIDLGTTNCSICYIDTDEPEHQLHDFAVTQLVAAGETAAERMLPSFCYLPGGHDLPQGALALPWDRQPTLLVGGFARDQGARIPDRLVSSAKSWLVHAGVDRTRPILPWGGELGPQMLSPVDASAHYLSHILKAWNRTFSSQKDADGTPCLLQNQQIVLTVPASFDETARELTVQAAKQAGLVHLTLIEEPLAAFYAWLAKNKTSWKQKTSIGDIVLVVDVGGGTTDLTIIEIEDNFVLRRKAVGEHLLLGGDNMDMALAHAAESSWNTKLPQRQWTRLCQECRHAKELLLAEDAPDETQITLAGEGSSMFAKLKTYNFKRQEVLDTILEGFFPQISSDSPPPERRRGIREMGLPYAADAAVTKHLLSFLKFAGRILKNPVPLAKPTKVLFNGGAMLPAIVRSRLLDTIADWCDGIRPEELESADFSLAVSEGASFYGLARLGQVVRVKGGIANAYFLEIQQEQSSKLLCVMPRDTDEGIVCTLPETFKLQANTPVAFPLHASATRLEDKLGDLLDDRKEITPLPPLRTLLMFGRKNERTELNVRLSSRLNEVGTLEVWCEAVDTGHRFPLSFELRGLQSSQEAQSPETVVDEARIKAAMSLMENAFENSPESLPKLLGDMEKALELKRADWGAAFLRQVADMLLQHLEWRSITPAHEARWLNLVGFALRPGTGRVGDEARVRTVWKLWKPGPLAVHNAAVLQNWFIFWRRLAGGLSSGQQEQISGQLGRELLPRDGSNLRLKKNDQTEQEKWRCLAAMERTAPAFKLKCLQAFLNAGTIDDAAYWCIARWTARQLLHGTADMVIPASKLSPLFPTLLASIEKTAKPHLALLAIAAAVTQTGSRTLDLPDSLRQTALNLLHRHQASEDWLQSDSLKNDLRGDTLPLGLSIE